MIHKFEATDTIWSRKVWVGVLYLRSVRSIKNTCNTIRAQSELHGATFSCSVLNYVQPQRGEPSGRGAESQAALSRSHHRVGRTLRRARLPQGRGSRAAAPVHSLTCSGISTFIPVAGTSPERVGIAAPASVPAAKGSLTIQRRRQAGRALSHSAQHLPGSQPIYRCSRRLVQD
ncbi:hypothetical protein NDU88_001841 [Pleurodeles waltl]|uniref:Uncharacterized protein n=1 Tax=Pleurodeles waltl TaxID=8319 RepID=A0AAV7UX86_PLEWA|nr:hypothetical protein NDU88_001841 [Pleurodeles waltl]